MRRRRPERRPPDQDEIRLLVKRLLRDVRHPDSGVIAELKAACGDHPDMAETALYYVARNRHRSIEDLVDHIMQAAHASTLRAARWTL